jgi:hypothetical protein
MTTPKFVGRELSAVIGADGVAHRCAECGMREPKHIAYCRTGIAQARAKLASEPPHPVKPSVEGHLGEKK